MTIVVSCLDCENTTDDEGFTVLVQDLAPWRVDYWLGCNKCGFKKVVHSRDIGSVEKEIELRQRLVDKFGIP